MDEFHTARFCKRVPLEVDDGIDLVVRIKGDGSIRTFTRSGFRQ